MLRVRATPHADVVPAEGLRCRTPAEALLSTDHAIRAAIGLATLMVCPVCNGPTVRILSRALSDALIRSLYLDPERDGDEQLVTFDETFDVVSVS